MRPGTLVGKPAPECRVHIIVRETVHLDAENVHLFLHGVGTSYLRVEWERMCCRLVELSLSRNSRTHISRCRAMDVPRSSISGSERGVALADPESTISL